MELKKQMITGVNELFLENVNNDSLLNLKVEIGKNTNIPDDNRLIIYVDNVNSQSPSENRKEYIIPLNDQPEFFKIDGNAIILNFNVEDSDHKLNVFTNREIINDDIQNYVLDKEITKNVGDIKIELLDNSSYIYTNYGNAIITVDYLERINYNMEQNENEILESRNSALNNESTSDAGLTWDDIYFKDAFTQSGNNLDLEVNHASIDCLTSRNNAFNLDSSGNLTVNSITVSQGEQSFTRQQICDFIYPVGSIYLAVNSTSPASLFGGTWVQIKDSFLLACGNSYANGSTGGSATHSHSQGATGGPSTNTSGSTALTINQIPSHTHTVGTQRYRGQNLWGVPSYQYLYDTLQLTDSETTAVGGGQGHTHTLSSHTHTNPNTNSSSNMPPYLAVYIWKRTA